MDRDDISKECKHNQHSNCTGRIGFCNCICKCHPSTYSESVAWEDLPQGTITWR